MTGKPYRTPRSMLSAVTLMSGTRDVADDILRLYNGVGGRRWVPDHRDSGHVQHAADNLFDRAYLRSRLRRRAVPVTDSWASFSVSHAVSELHAAMNLYHLSNASQPHRTSGHRNTVQYLGRDKKRHSRMTGLTFSFPVATHFSAFLC